MFSGDALCMKMLAYLTLRILNITEVHLSLLQDPNTESGHVEKKAHQTLPDRGFHLKMLLT